MIAISLSSPHTSSVTSSSREDDVTFEQIATHPVAVRAQRSLPANDSRLSFSMQVEWLKDFLMQEHNVEGLSFFMSVQYYRTLFQAAAEGAGAGADLASQDQEQHIAEIARTIFNEFIAQDSPHTVNISFETKYALARSLEMLQC